MLTDVAGGNMLPVGRMTPLEKDLTAIAARISMLLACLPLLLPTGVCLCDASSDGCAQTVVVDAADSHDCCSNCHQSTTPSPNCPTPCDDHLPTCPAAKLEVSHWTKPTVSLSFDFLPTIVSQIAEPIEAATVSATSHVSVSFWPSAPPRYLSNCSLLF